MKFHPSIVLGLTLLASLAFARPADAQLLWRWFGPKAPDKAAPTKASAPEQRRLTEINVEIAWLADPVTFPYYLEAHATSTQLEVRGYVPTKAVREQAMRIAQVYSSLPVVDSIKEHASLLVRPGQMSTQQLQASVQSSLKVAVPKAHAQLKVQVSPDGKVYVAGPVSTVEEKIAVSHSLRRLHGCTSVQNLTTAPLDLAQAPPIEDPRERTPIVRTSSNPEKKAEKPVVAVETKSRPWYWPFGKSAPSTTKDEPPLLDKTPPPTGPILIPDGPAPKNEVVKVVLPTPIKTPSVTANDLQKRVKATCPNVRNVEVEFTSATEVRVILEIRNEKELNAAVDRIFALPELQNYRADLQFKISTP